MLSFMGQAPETADIPEILISNCRSQTELARDVLAVESDAREASPERRAKKARTARRMARRMADAGDNFRSAWYELEVKIWEEL